MFPVNSRQFALLAEGREKEIRRLREAINLLPAETNWPNSMHDASQTKHIPSFATATNLKHWRLKAAASGTRRSEDSTHPTSLTRRSNTVRAMK